MDADTEAGRTSGVRLELLIFDCDGVVVDSEVISCRCAAEAFGLAGVRIDAAEIQRRFLGVGREEMMRRVEAESGVALPVDFLNRLIATIRSEFEAGLRPIDRIAEAVKQLDVRRCVASGSDLEYIVHALKLTGLFDLFSPNLFSASMVPRGKPAPDLFLYAASRMGARPEHCLVIEDSEVGVRAGKAAGMAVFGFVGGSHLMPAIQAATMQAAGSDLLFDSMAALPWLVRESFEVVA